MQERSIHQINNTQSSQSNYYNRADSPAHSPWLKQNGVSPNFKPQGSISMQREINDDMNNNNQPSSNEDNNDEENAERLSSEFSSPFTVFVSVVIVLTMSLLIYSNSQDGAFVEVQVTPKIPNTQTAHSLMIRENITPFTANLLTYTTDGGVFEDEFDAELMIYGLIETVEDILSKYPHFKLLESYDGEIDLEYLLENKQNITKILDELNFDPTETYKFNVFHFTLTSSIDDFWSAHAYSLAFIIAAFSGAWPYLKLLLLLVIWLHPMKPKQRKRGLLFLDQFGKYSFIDLYVMVFMVVAFYLKITEETASGLGIEVAVVVEIDHGVTTFAIATLVSMIYSMIFIYFDEQKRLNKLKKENQVDDDDKNNNNDMKIRKKVDIDCFENEIEPHSSLYIWKKENTLKIYALYALPNSLMGVLWRCLFLTLLVLNIWLCIDTLYTAPVRYVMQGLAGWAVDNNIRTNTIIGTVNLLPYSTDEHFAAWFCVVQYYMTVVIAPILISSVLVCVWLMPMNYKYHNIICHLLLPLQAWNALDVFMVGCIAASVELDEVSQWILNTNFPGVCGDDGVIENLVHVGCFSVQGHIVYGSIMLAAFVIFEWFALIYTRNHIDNAHRKFAKFDFKPIQL